MKTAAALRTGLLVPINNTTMEPELLEWLPRAARAAGWAFRAARAC